jgi:hypothetical protein
VPWDRERYRLEVLEPARQRGNVPPADLYVRYGLPRGTASADAFSRQISEVLAYWRELKNRRTYARLAETLIAAHAELERTGQLTPERLATRQREQRERLARLAATEAGAATHVGPSTVTRLRAALGMSVTDEEVAQALASAGVQVVAEFPRLPGGPHPKQAALAEHTQVLGWQLSAEAVFGGAVREGFRVLGGFRLTDGRRLDEPAIAAQREKAAALPHTDPAKSHQESVLALLSGAARAGDLDTLLLSEVVEWLRQFADQGFIQRAIATQARELGLVEDEAGLVAAAMLSRDTIDTVRQQVTAELAAGRLRAARRLVTGLPPDDPLRERVTEREAQVSTLIRRADQELAAGRTEQAAMLLAEALGMASDDTQLAGRLAGLAPPPPGGADARIDGDHVLITWEPSPALAGELHYRVVRGHGRAPASAAEGTIVISQTTGHDVTDTSAPLGADLGYAVFAGRGDDSWSRPAAAPSLPYTPEVTIAAVAVEETSVTASWRAHQGAGGVLVTRREGQPPREPADGTPVDASLTGFTDTGLRTGAEYFYLAVVSYRAPGGQDRRSAGTVLRAVPEPGPDPVTGLAVRCTAGGTPTAVATWVPPRHGHVRLVLTDGPPRWPAGTRLMPGDVAGLPEVTGAPCPGSAGRVCAELRLPYGHHHLLALTMAGGAVMTGDRAEFRLAEPVRDLTADRMHDAVRLAWIWPDDDAEAAEIRWPGGEHRCLRRVYDDEGGVTVTVGPAATRIEVRLSYPHPGPPQTGPVAEVPVRGQGVRVDYRIRRPRQPFTRQHVIELAAEHDARLPGLLVVRSTGRYPPDDPAEGEPVARFPPQPITPGQPVTITVEPARGQAWLACFADPDDPHSGDRAVILCPPPGDEMRIR